jgi:hypothetical protein
MAIGPVQAEAAVRRAAMPRWASAIAAGLSKGVGRVADKLRRSKVNEHCYLIKHIWVQKLGQQLDPGDAR